MPLKFAVVREDPRIEIELALRSGAREVLLAASGGCTAFALAHALPEVRVALYDFNPAQLEHVHAKARAIAAGDFAALNVGDARPDGLSQCGEFERLFRVLRAAVVELVAPAAALEGWFEDGDGPGPEAWCASPYWPAIFHAAFTDALLVAMFGPAAVQHAERGTYPAYFQRAFEGGLGRPDARHNPFLQHVLLGRYLERDAPEFLLAGRAWDFESTLGGVPDVPQLQRFGLVHLSNIFDWSDDEAVARWCRVLRALRPGAVITVRQLNNQRAVRHFLEPWFRFDDALAASLHASDRSLFYERLLVATRTEAAA